MQQTSNGLTRVAMFALLCLLGSAGFALEGDDRLQPGSASRAPSSLAEATKLEREGNTVIISSIDNPLTTNILAWKETASEFAKNAIEFSALKDSLTPTDRDRLREETQYSKVLNQAP